MKLNIFAFCAWKCSKVRLQFYILYSFYPYSCYSQQKPTDMYKQTEKIKEQNEGVINLLSVWVCSLDVLLIAVNLSLDVFIKKDFIKCKGCTDGITWIGLRRKRNSMTYSIFKIQVDLWVQNRTFSWNVNEIYFNLKKGLQQTYHF